MAGVARTPASLPEVARAAANLLGRASVRWASVILIIIVWEGAALSGAVTEFMLPQFSTVLERIWDDAVSGELPGQIVLTLYRCLSGFAIAAVAGVVLGLAIPRSRGVSWFLDPVISVALPMPKIVFLPIVTLWLGFGDVSKIFMVVIDSVFPVITATVAGTQAVEKELLWSARSMGASERQVWREIVLPAALPQVLTGLQVALPIALIVGIVTEMLTGADGLGGTMIQASRIADSPGVFAGLLEMGVIGYCVLKAMSALRRRLLLWHQESLAPTTA
ncbi:MAG: ABC transporter permease [Betaproteobacteria bacterium]|nr:ABC transporter permease [Betaproteobacteria bacterium]